MTGLPMKSGSVTVQLQECLDQLSGIWESTVGVQFTVEVTLFSVVNLIGKMTK